MRKETNTYGESPRFKPTPGLVPSGLLLSISPWLSPATSRDLLVFLLLSSMTLG